MVQVYDVLRIISITALFSYGYSLFVQTVQEVRFRSIAAGFATHSIMAWVRATAESLSRESFWHSLFSAGIMRDLPVPLVYRSVVFRTWLSAAEILIIALMVRTIPAHPVYLFLAVSFILRVVRHEHRQLASSFFFGVALFLLPLLHPQVLELSAGIQPSPDAGGTHVLLLIVPGVLLFAAARMRLGTTPLLAVILLLEHTGRIPPETIPVFTMAIFAGSNAALHAWAAKPVSFANGISRILVLDTVCLVACTVLARILYPAGGYLTAVLILVITGSADLLLRQRTNPNETIPRTVLADPLSYMEGRDYRVCRKSEYTVALIRHVFICTADNFSRLRVMMQDIQNAGTLASETRSIRTRISRDDQAITATGECISKTAHILMNHHPDHTIDRMQDTLLQISRYTIRISGKIVNISEYFDRLRKKDAFFSDEQSMAVTELLAMVNDLTGYVSDYLSSRVYTIDPSVLSEMEHQIQQESAQFKRGALIRLEQFPAGNVRTNLTVIETIETIASILHDLDRTSSLAGKIEQIHGIQNTGHA